MRYFKIRVNYGERDDCFIHIDETELEKAFLCFLTEAKAIFSGGPVRGKDIIGITEDWHRDRGWNQSHVMEDDDWQEVKVRCGHYTGLIAEAKERVQFLIKKGQQHLIGTGVHIPELAKKTESTQIDNLITGLVLSKQA